MKINRKRRKRMHYSYSPRGVCSSRIEFDIDRGRLKNVAFTGGCNGNLKAIGKLVEGMEAERVMLMLRGNTCEDGDTSCADQLARAIERALQP